MADVFIEHMVVRKKNVLDRVISVLYVLAFILINMLFLSIDILSIFLPVSLAGGGWLLLVLIRAQTVEYEYIVTNGIVDVDKITGKRKRKRLASLDCRNFEILAPLSGSEYKSYENTKFAKTMNTTSNTSNSNSYFAVCPAKEGGKLLFIFEPSEKMMDAFKIYISRVIKQ